MAINVYTTAVGPLWFTSRVPFVNCGEPAVVCLDFICLDFICLDFIYLPACVAGNYQPELLGKYPSRLIINLLFIGDYLHPCLFTTMSSLEPAGSNDIV